MILIWETVYEWVAFEKSFLINIKKYIKDPIFFSFSYDEL